jgi:hypothetical protein
VDACRLLINRVYHEVHALQGHRPPNRSTPITLQHRPLPIWVKQRRRLCGGTGWGGDDKGEGLLVPPGGFS